MNKLWICGQLLGEWDERGTAWAFQGVFDDEKKADAACRDATYFIFPANCNEELPHESVYAEDARYPRIEEQLPEETTEK